MLYDEIQEPDAVTADELRARYEAELTATIESVGVDAVVERTGVDEGVVGTLAEGASVELSVADAAAILATGEDAPTSDVILAEVRDTLLMGMTNAVLDVDAIAADVDVDLTGKEVQQRIEGRTPMTLAEYAELHRFIAGEADW